MIDIPLAPPPGLGKETKEFTVFDAATGAIVLVGTAQADQVAAMVPAGCDYCDGQHDYRAFRINPATREPEAIPPPDDSVEIAARGALLRQMEIDRIELATLRALREYALGDQSARARLQAIDDEIADKRRDL